MTLETSSRSRARRIGVLVGIALTPFALATTPAAAIDGVGGGDTTSARDQYDSGPDVQATPAPTGAPAGSAGAAGTQPTAAASKRPAAKKPAKKKPTKKRQRRGTDDGSGVAGDDGDGTRDPDGAGVLGDGGDGSRSGAGDPAQGQRQLQAGGDLPFTGWTIAPVALLGAGLLAAGFVLRRRATRP